MKLTYFSVLVVAAINVNAQQIKPSTLGIHYSLTDFETCAKIQSTSVHDVLKNHQWSHTSQMMSGIGVDFYKGITPNIDFAAGFNYTKGANNFKLPVSNTTSYALTTLDAILNFKLLKDEKFVSPYLVVGGGIYIQHGAGFYAPVGGGIQLYIFKSAFVHIQTVFRAPFSKRDYGCFYYSVGISAPFNKKKKTPVVIQDIKPVDTDGDGIVDKDDSCVNVAGDLKYNGCPIPDSDGDGINDEEDKCPFVFGFPKYNGCPVPDTDKDGLNDEQDSCINQPGPVNNNGCPVKQIPSPEIQKQINFAARNIYFETGKAILKPESNNSLNEVVKILNDNLSINLIINGYTDNVGKPAANLLLSEKRANAVLYFLVSAGINPQRISAKGFGQAQPIATNDSAEGRAKNRRVEIKIAD